MQAWAAIRMCASSRRSIMRPSPKPCGVKGIRVEQPGQIAAAIEQALAAPGSVVLDVLADPNAMPPVAAFSGLPNY